MAVNRYILTSAVSLAAGTPASETELLPTNPAAGALFTYTNATGGQQVLQSVKFTLTTDAVVANRFASVQIKDATGQLIAQQANLTAVAASSTLIMMLDQGLANIPNGASGTVLGGLPSTVTLLPGWQVVINVSAMDAGDTITNIAMTFDTPGTTLGVGSGATSGGERLWPEPAMGPVTFPKGQLIALDPAGPLFAQIGAGNLQLVTPAQETGGFLGTFN